MAATKKTWIYLINGILTPVIRDRPTGKGKWKAPSEDQRYLVMAYEGTYGDMKLSDVGPLYAEHLVGECYKLHLGITQDNFKSDIWLTVPEEVKKSIGKIVLDAEQKIVRQHAQASNEEFLTGLLFGDVDSDSREQGWDVKIRYIEFSKQSKEPTTGADIAIVLDVTDGLGYRAFKSIWFQAKTAKSVPQDVLRLPRLEGQLETMKRHTDEAYALIYTPAGVLAARADRPTKLTPLDKLLVSAMNCNAGDPSAELLVNSMSRKHVLSVMIDRATHTELEF